MLTHAQSFGYCTMVSLLFAWSALIGSLIQHDFGDIYLFFLVMFIVSFNYDLSKKLHMLDGKFYASLFRYIFLIFSYWMVSQDDKSFRRCYELAM